MKVRIHLSYVYRNNAAIRFQFNDDRMVDNKIESVLTDPIWTVPNFDRFLPIDMKRIVLQFCCQRPAIDAFHEAWSQCSMDTAGRIQDSIHQALFSIHEGAAVQFTCFLLTCDGSAGIR
jgi:hypothetical protein